MTFDSSPTWEPAPTPAAAPAAAPAPAPRRRRMPGVGAVLGAAVLAAVLASGSTFALVEYGLGQNTATSPSAAPGTNASLTATGANTTPADSSAVAAAALPSVVTITESTTVANRSGRSADATGVGSGIILTSDGYILTNNHVVENSTSLSVLLPDGRTVSATVVKTDPANDLAVVKANATGLTPAKLGDSSTIQVGESVLAIGSPLGTFTGSVTEGIISATNRTITVNDNSSRNGKTLSGLLQTDAAINPGNSGGPLVDAAGKVVGVATAGSTQANGLNFAIPIDTARTLISQSGVTI
jgi:putative serine protease PepD